MPGHWRHRTSCAAFVVLLSGCGGHAVDLDDPTTAPAESSQMDDTLVHGPSATYLWLAGERLFLTGVYRYDVVPTLRSCLKSHCDDSLIDYTEVEPGSVALSAHDLVFWRESIFACKESGCGQGPSLVYDGYDATQLAFDGSYVYWASVNDSSVYRCPLAGCQTPSEIASRQFPVEEPPVVVGDQAYWRVDDELRHTRVDGSAPVEVAIRYPQIADLNIVDETAYFVDEQNRIRSCPIADCSDPQVFVDSEAQKFMLRADAAGVFWLEKDYAVHFCEAAGCSSGPKKVTPELVYMFAIDESYVYWSEKTPGDPGGASAPTQESGFTGGPIHRTPR
jgi:hypothetical protein